MKRKRSEVRVPLALFLSRATWLYARTHSGRKPGYTFVHDEAMHKRLPMVKGLRLLLKDDDPEYEPRIRAYLTCGCQIDAYTLDDVPVRLLPRGSSTYLLFHVVSKAKP